MRLTVCSVCAKNDLYKTVAEGILINILLFCFTHTTIINHIVCSIVILLRLCVTEKDDLCLQGVSRRVSSLMKSNTHELKYILPF